jgi:hypothetical protein
VDDGPTIYRGIRDEIAWYFGQGLVGELDRLEEEGKLGHLDKERRRLAEQPIPK